MFPVNTIIAWYVNIYHKYEDMIITTLLLPLGHISNRMSTLSSVKTLLVLSLILVRLEKLVFLCFLLKLVIIAIMVYVILVLVLVLFLMSFTGKLCMKLVLVSLRTLMWLFTLQIRKPYAPLAL